MRALSYVHYDVDEFKSRPNGKSIHTVKACEEFKYEMFQRLGCIRLCIDLHAVLSIGI